MLRAFRKSAGLTQAGVAGLLGIAQQTYAALEANPGSASTERVLRVLRILKVDMTLSWPVRARRDTPRALAASNAGKRPPAPGKSKEGAVAQKRAANRKPGAVLSSSSGSAATGRKGVTPARKTAKRVIRKREDW
jgi:HTH-type transcriptional regulator / antitoxin HipB